MTPDNADSQQPGLTDADNIRFEDAMEAYRVADNHYLGCLAIFEYATLYERSRKADELSKAQARIRELEVAQKGNLARLDELNAFVKGIWEVLEIPSSLILKETANGVHLLDLIRGMKQENNELRKLTDQLLNGHE